jgi:outer membrane immunogenic protein
MTTLAGLLRGEMGMPKLFRDAILLGFFTGFIGLSARPASAQVAGMEVGGEYSFVNTNAPPGGCGCFSMNGGTGWFAYNLFPNLAVIGEIGGEYASNIDHTSADLTLTSFLGGARYSRRWLKEIAPFGQLLLGGAHASGALTPTSSGQSSSANAFAMVAGGGMDLEMSRHWKVRLIEVDYFLTRFDNGSNDHQNNLRVSLGVAYRFGGRK